MAPDPWVFISYARSDGAEFANGLRTRLEAEHVSVWQDICRLRGGTMWEAEIRKAINDPDLTHFLLVLTDAALDRPIVEWEWRQARWRGKCVVPIRASLGLDIAELKAWMRASTIVDLKSTDDWNRLFLRLRSPYYPLRVVNMAPKPQSGVVPRPEWMGELKRRLLDLEHGCPIATVVALAGTGGFGKTTLAEAFCHDNDVLDIYYDGILWVDLGKEPGDLTERVLNLIERLEGARPGYTDERSAISHFQELLWERAILVVIDDAWGPDPIEALRVLGERCGCLITTRRKDCLPDDADELDVVEMSAPESVELLGTGVDGISSDSLTTMAQSLGHWPLLLSLANGQLRSWVKKGVPASVALSDLERAFMEHGPTAFDPRQKSQRWKAIGSVLDLSLDQLSKAEAHCFNSLAVFPSATNVPLAIASTLWAAVGGLDASQTRALCEHLADVSLIQHLDLGASTIRIADAIRSLLHHRIKNDLTGLHRSLAEAYPRGQSWTPECARTYLLRHLPWHLSHAGMVSELKALLLDYSWLQAKLASGGIGGLLDDLNLLDDADFALVRAAIRLSVRYIARDPSQLGSQLRGRLLGKGGRAIAKLLESIETASPKPLFLHRVPTFQQPGGALLCTFPAPPTDLTAIAVDPDGRQAVSGDADGRLRLWDLETGSSLLELGGSGDTDDPQDPQRERAISAVTFVCRDCSPRVLSGSEDGVVILWDLSEGTARYVFDQGDEASAEAGHAGAVTAVTSPGHCDIGLTADAQGEIGLWSLNSGTVSAICDAGAGSIAAVAMYANGARALVSFQSGELRAWDLESGTELHRDRGHVGVPHLLAVVGEGPKALLVGSEGRLVLIDAENGKEIPAFPTVRTDFSVLAALPDGAHAISGHSDGTLLVWTLPDCRPVKEHRQRIEPVRFLVPTGVDMQVLVGSGRNRLDLLDMSVKAELSSLEQHAERVDCTAIVRNGTQAITGSRDGLIRIWDSTSGRCTASHDLRSPVVALSPQMADGRFWVGTADGALWRLEIDAEDPLEVTEWILGTVTAVTADTEGRWGIFGTGGGSIWLWRGDGFDAPVKVGQVPAAVTAVEVVDAGRVLGGYEDGTVRLWSLDEPDPILEMALEGDAGVLDPEKFPSVTSIAVHPSGDAALIGWSDGVLRARDLDTGETLKDFAEKRGRIAGIRVDWRRDEAMIAWADADDPTDLGVLGLWHVPDLWDIESAHCLSTLLLEAAPTAIALAADGRGIVVGDADGKVHFLDVRSA